LRRTFVSNLLDAGVDIATEAKMAGHSNIQTTAHYDRKPEDAKKSAAQFLNIPYSSQHDNRKNKHGRESHFAFFEQRTSFDIKFAQEY